MNPIKESFKFYARNIEYLLLLSVTILLPFLIFHTIVVNYIYYIYDQSIYSFFGDFANSFFMIIVFVVSQIPFIQFVQSDLEGEEKRLRKSYLTFLDYSFSVFLFGILYAVSVVFGTILFFLPGIILLVFFYLTPYFTVMRKKSIRNSWIIAFETAKRKFFSILALVFITGIIEWIIGLIGFYGVGMITSNYGALLGSQMLLNMIFFPYIVILSTMYIRKWQGLEIV